MKGDFTRSTFKPEKHYSRVLMQQGRVQLDADWNEQLDISAYRRETQASDALGACAAPLHAAAFGIVTDPNSLSVQERTRLQNLGLLPLAVGDFILSAGRFYVDGLLCENEHALPFSAQPDLTGAQPVASAGTYLAYLDVWERHITALEHPSIREVALGGPDTATRAQVIWQVKLLPVEAPDPNCLSELPEWQDVTEGSAGALSARAQPETTSSDPCIVPPSAGFRGLQNQLYRVEIHTAGGLGSATFKWSRDNGSLVFPVLEFMGGLPTDRLRLRSLGRDKDVALGVGDWVEVLDDDLELSGMPGLLAQITDIDSDDRIITLNQDVVSGISLDRHPKVRRWDSAGALDVEVPGGNDGFIPLEDGVEVMFTSGSYHSGDYWLIPARTILGNPELTETGGIEWPMDGSDPLAQPPQGIHHHYCRLALLEFDGTTFTIEDCRPLFPPATELLHLFYMSGDGQEAMPGNQLPQPLQAGVSNGQWPVEGATVRFRTTLGGGSLQSGADSGAELNVATGPDGVAEVTWTLDGSTLSQQVEATLLDADGDPLHLPLRYNANLSVAEQVAYDPTDCDNLSTAATVQEAIDQLCQNAALYYVGGDGQEALPGEKLPQPLEVRLANGQWPVEGETVIFRILEPGFGTLEGGGTSGQSVDVQTDENGLAACTWTLDAQNPSQRVEAFWKAAPDLPIHFNASHDVQGGESQEPGVRIQDVRFLASGEPVANNQVFPVNILMEGIVVDCDREVAQMSVRNRPVCFVTLDLPFPFNSADREIWGNQVVAYQPLILEAQVNSDNNQIFWTPLDSTRVWLAERLFPALKAVHERDQVLLHLTLKGNFIWEQDNPRIYVDGEAFALPDGQTPHNLRLPSGDRRRGGDFELWFRLVAG
ncbi:MAG: DUF6519 domain-containing protein, partial [Anaerolineales bacterium]